MMAFDDVLDALPLMTRWRPDTWQVPSDAAFAAAFALVMHARCGLRAESRAACVGLHALLAATDSALGLAVGAAAPR